MIARISLVLSIVASLCSVAIAKPLDLTAEQIPAYMNAYRIIDEGEQSFVLTGIPRLDDKKQTSYLAISPLNPIWANKGLNTETVFAGMNRRPLRYTEALSTCRSLKTRAKKWTLPDEKELQILNNIFNFRERVLNKKAKAEEFIAGPYEKMITQLGAQFEFFWMKASETRLETGLRLAGYFHAKEGKYQLMSQDRFLNTICVSYLSGPESKQSIEMQKNAETLTEKTLKEYADEELSKEDLKKKLEQFENK